MEPENKGEFTEKFGRKVHSQLAGQKPTITATTKTPPDQEGRVAKMENEVMCWLE